MDSGLHGSQSSKSTQHCRPQISPLSAKRRLSGGTADLRTPQKPCHTDAWSRLLLSVKGTCAQLTHRGGEGRHCCSETECQAGHMHAHGTDRPDTPTSDSLLGVLITDRLLQRKWLFLHLAVAGAVREGAVSQGSSRKRHS